jgi:hypothetical protein
LCFAHPCYFSSFDKTLPAFALDSAQRTNLCESSRQRRTLLRERRLPAPCVPHGAPSGFATFTPAWSFRLSVPSPLISLLPSSERGTRMWPVRSSRRSSLPPGACAGQGRGPTTYPHADTLGSRPYHAASRQPLRGERFAPSKFPPIFGSCLHVNPPLSASDSALCSSARCRFVCPALRPRVRPPRAPGTGRAAAGRAG